MKQQKESMDLDLDPLIKQMKKQDIPLKNLPKVSKYSSDYLDTIRYGLM